MARKTLSERKADKLAELNQRADPYGEHLCEAPARVNLIEGEVRSAIQGLTDALGSWDGRHEPSPAQMLREYRQDAGA